MSDKPYKAPALEKGIAIIELLASAPAPLSMVEIGEALSRSKHELYRMLMSLEDLNWLARTSDEKFHLTNRLFDVAMRSPPHRNLHEAALPVMQALSKTVEQSCHIAVASGDDIVVVARMESPGLLGFAVRVGYRRPVTGSTSGRVLFGCASDEHQTAWQESLRQHSSKKDFKAFVTDATQVKADGIITMSSDFVPGVTDVSVPVFDSKHGSAVAALTIPYLTSGTSSATLDETKAALMTAGAAISNTLTLG